MSTRPARCHECHTPALLTNHLCDACQRLHEARLQAFAYVNVINHLCADYSAESLVSYMLGNLVLKSGMQAPLILQAVADRVEWLDKVTYPAVAEIALAEARALIPGIWVA